jgi:hypothetical protein
MEIPESELVKVLNEKQLLLDNLTACQKLCNEQLEELRTLRDKIEFCRVTQNWLESTGDAPINREGTRQMNVSKEDYDKIVAENKRLCEELVELGQVCSHNAAYFTLIDSVRAELRNSREETCQLQKRLNGMTKIMETASVSANAAVVTLADERHAHMRTVAELESQLDLMTKMKESSTSGESANEENRSTRV